MSVSPKRVALIGPSVDAMGGISSVIRNILQEYPLAEEYELLAVPTIVGKPSLGVYLKALRNVHRMAKAGQLDLAHVHMSSRGSFLRKAILIRICHADKVPVIIHMHSGGFRAFFAKLWKPFQSFVVKTFSMAECVVALSEAWLPFFYKVLDVRRAVVIVNSVALPELAEPSRYEQEPPLILFLGRLGKSKGAYDLIEAVRLLREGSCTRPFRLIMAGDGDVDGCAALVEKYGISDTIHLPGWIGPQEKEKLLRSAHIIALPSYAEGCPMSLLEGMSYGLAALGSDIPSISAVVREGKDGMLAAAGNIEALSSCMARLVQDDALRRELGQNARERIRQDFSNEVISVQLSGLYRSLLSL